jgi:hypothetical protein
MEAIIMTFQEFRKKFDHLVTLSSSTTRSDYLVVKISSTSTNFLNGEILAVRLMLILYAQKNNIPEKDISKLIDPKLFGRYFKSALEKAGENNRALIFKYRPSEDVKTKYKKFHEAIRESGLWLSSVERKIIAASFVLQPSFDELMDVL